MDQQKKVLMCFENNDEVLTKQEIIEKAPLTYFYNTDKHAGDVLTRMVRNGLLERVKRGHYKRTGKTKRHFKKDEFNPNQEKLEL